MDKNRQGVPVLNDPGPNPITKEKILKNLQQNSQQKVV